MGDGDRSTNSLLQGLRAQWWISAKNTILYLKLSILEGFPPCRCCLVAKYDVVMVSLLVLHLLFLMLACGECVANCGSGALVECSCVLLVCLSF